MSDYYKQFISTFKQLTFSSQNWRVWSDFIEMSAIALRNAVNTPSEHEKLEKRYLELINAYRRDDQQLFPKLLATIVQAFDANTEQDFLGVLFQELELNSHWKGQFFTPYNLCRMIADMQAIDIRERLNEKGFISVNDPACGAGALLIAFANSVKKRGVNYQQDVLFVGQDIDRTAALMCYIQIALLGCPGYVVIGDTITRPDKHPENEVWYTPMYFRRSWLPKAADLKKVEAHELDLRFDVDTIQGSQEIVQLTLF